MNPFQTVKEAIESSTALLQKNEVDSPRLDSEALLAHALGVGRTQLHTNPSRILNKNERDTFLKMVSRRAEREPTAYILGEKEFWSLTFRVDRRALIPRPETETLVQCVLDHAPRTDIIKGLDLGTGSGVIPIVLAKELDLVSFIAVDSSQEALALAEENARIHGVEEKIVFAHGDLFQPLGKSKGESFDFIVSNPPYIPKTEIKTLQPEIRLYEPLAALDGGTDGLECVQKIILTAPDYLKPHGFLCMEIGADQGEAVKKMMVDANAYGEVEIIKDLAGLDRVAIGKRLD